MFFLHSTFFTSKGKGGNQETCIMDLSNYPLLAGVCRGFHLSSQPPNEKLPPCLAHLGNLNMSPYSRQLLTLIGPELGEKKQEVLGGGMLENDYFCL